MGKNNIQLKQPMLETLEEETIAIPESSCKTTSPLRPSKIKFKEKEFRVRDSVLTTLLEDKNCKSIYLIIVIMFVILVLDQCIYEYKKFGRVYVASYSFLETYGRFHEGLGIWALMQITVFSVYLVFRIWAYVNDLFRDHNYKLLKGLWNICWLIFFIQYQIIFMFAWLYLVYKIDLPFGTGMIIGCETLRFIMKVHSFVRYNAPTHLAERKKERCYTFKSFLYFLFAPTLLYRHSYPRTNKIRWKLVFGFLVEFYAVLFYLQYYYERVIKENFENFGKEPVTFVDLAYHYVRLMPPSAVFYVCIFLHQNHAWPNAMAELLKFGDRKFHEDWWTTDNFDVYYRTSNVIVYDWLFEYIYKDLTTHFLKKYRILCSILVALLSAGLHDYLFSWRFGFIYPMVLFLFGIVGSIVIGTTKFLSRPVGRWFILASMFVGNSWMVMMYAMEFYARKNCDQGASILDTVSWRFIISSKCMSD